jgi:hypothetical protein
MDQIIVTEQNMVHHLRVRKPTFSFLELDQNHKNRKIIYFLATLTKVLQKFSNIQILFFYILNWYTKIRFRMSKSIFNGFLKIVCGRDR